MDLLALKPAAFRHVVFPPSIPGGVPAINFTAHPVPAPSPPAPDPATPVETEAFLRWVFEQGGLNVRDYKMETLRRRLPACVRALRAHSLAEARQAIQRHPWALKAALGSLIIGVTGFFRDPAVFASLQEQILPEITARGATARIWSAGCSEGPELYSVAIQLAELKSLHRCYLLGTDCRPESIRLASGGAYDSQMVKSVPPDLLARYFVQEGPHWRIHSWLRTVVQWRGGNALDVCEPGAWDMILCRNMSIYLLSASTARLWRALAAALRPGGVLVVGKAERPLGTPGLSMMAPCIYRRE